jgi:hypothetical protein
MTTYKIEMRKVRFDGEEFVTDDTHTIVGTLDEGQTLSDVMDTYQNGMPGWTASRGQIVSK